MDVASRTRAGLAILGSGLALGIAGDGLLHVGPSGINVPLFLAGLVGSLWVVSRRSAHTTTRECRSLALLTVVIAAGFAWRDSPTLQALDGLAVLLLLSRLLTIRPRRRQPTGILGYARATAVSGLRTLFGPPALVLGDLSWRQVPCSGGVRLALALGRGLLLAAPLLLVFGGLFMSADAVFARLVRRAFNIDPLELLAHLLLTALIAWLVTGFLRTALLGDDDGAPAEGPRPAFLRLGTVETGVVLSLLDLLFLVFVLVQLRYFFGGVGLVLDPSGPTYAEYARRGFFELVTVSALVLPMLLVLDWLVGKESKRALAVFRALALVQVFLVCVVMASALGRMHLYQREYGLTELRFYTTAFMGWLATLFLWFVATVLAGRRERFLDGSLASALLALILLHAANPDAWIAAANVERATRGRGLDVDYLASLSADAAPFLRAALPALAAPDRDRLRDQLTMRWATEGEDWRQWNWARAQARRQALQHRLPVESWDVPRRP